MHMWTLCTLETVTKSKEGAGFHPGGGGGGGGEGNIPLLIFFTKTIQSTCSYEYYLILKPGQ